MWQDTVIALVTWVFIFSLLPMVYRMYRYEDALSQSLWTSIPTAVGLWIMGIAFATMEMWFSAIAECTIGVTWGLIALLTVRYRVAD